MRDIKIDFPKLGLPLLPLLGGVMLCVGPFLRWLSADDKGTLQGLQWSPGVALCIFGALALIVTVLAIENERRLSAALTVIGALSLALVFHFVYVFFDEFDTDLGLRWGNVGEGFYVAGIGAFLTALSGCPLFRRLII